MAAARGQEPPARARACVDGESIGGSRRTRNGRWQRARFAAGWALVASLACAGPENGQIVSGLGGISQAGSTTTITQSSPTLSLTWKTFNVAANETVNFAQPSAAAIAVNRISDLNGSQILGRLNANGQIFLINPNGILFGQTAQVNVGGIVASTLDLHDATLDRDARLFTGLSESTAGVVNRGTLRTREGGYVALLGNTISNHGTITAPAGTVALGAGTAATLTFRGQSLVQMQVDRSVLNSLAENGGLIHADGGVVMMSAGAKNELLASVVNNTGVIQARRVENRGGTIILLGGMTAGRVEVGGTLDASAAGGGDGGFVETSAARVKIGSAAKITTAAATGLAGTWLIDPVDFTIAASGGDITGAALSVNLGGGDVIIQSSGGTAGTAGNVNVNDAVTWSAHKLTLNAQNNVAINANLNASGTASLAFEFGQGAVAAGNASNVITTGAAVNLPAGTSNFTTKQGSDGVTKNFTVITSLGAAGSVTTTDLQGMSGGLSTNYALGGNIDATATSSWNSGSGFLPVGSSGAGFTGTFEGLGHSITGLTINRGTSYIGLFGQTNAGAVIRNVGLFGGSIRGGDYVGGLVGNAGGTITNSYSTIGLTSTGALMGGLVGNNTGTIVNSYANTAINGGTNVGGLVGRNLGTIQGSYSAGTLRGSNRLGGLVGVNSSTISNSYSTVAVTSNQFVQDLFGGLVGQNTGPITNSYASGVMVVNPNNAGGLIGLNQGGVITNSYWNTQTTGQATSSGGTARTTAQMQQSVNFTGWDFASTWTIYAGVSSPLLTSLITPLTVTANNQIKTYNGVAHTGGNGVTYSALVNGVAPAGTLTFSGSAQGKTDIGTYALTPGGLLSNQQYSITFVGGTLTINQAHLTVTADNASRSYGQANPTFTTTISGFMNGETAGTAAGFGGSATATSSATAATNAGTATITAGAGTLTATNYDFTTVVNGTLTIDRAHLTVTASDASRVYGQANPAFTATLSGFVNGETSANATGLTGSASATSAATASTDVGTATIAAGAGTLAATNYDFTNLVNGTLTITKAPLTATANAASKVYDGQNYSGGNGVTYVGFVNGETSAVLGGALSYSGSSQGAKNAGSFAITPQGIVATNYNLTFASGVLTINRAALTAIASVAGKTYDGDTSATVAVDALTGLVGGETIAATAVGTFDTKNAGTNKTVGVSYALADGTGLAANYTLANGSLTGAINPKALTFAGGSAANKTYDGTVNATVTSGSLSGLIGGETLTLTATAAFADKNAGANKSVGVAFTLGDGLGLASNYTAPAGGLTATISPLAIAVRGVTASDKIYDGTTSATLGGAATVVALAGDAVGVTGFGRGVFADKNAGIGKAVAVSGFTLSGADAGNYRIVQPANLSANITAANLAIGGVVARNKIYDGTTMALLGGAPTVSAISGDVVIVTGSGSGVFADQRVGDGKGVTVSGFTLSGVDAGNYTGVQPVGLTANIAAPDLNVAGTLQSILVRLPVEQTSGNAFSSSVGDSVATLDGYPPLVVNRHSRKTSPTSNEDAGATTVFGSGGAVLHVVDGGTKLPADRVKLQN